MNSFQLKIIAVSSMLIDHVGFFLLPQYSYLRIIGRIALPIFAFLIANGVKYTKNIDNYLKRLLIFALISQVPYLYAGRSVDPNFFSLNVLFTLSLGLLNIKYVKSSGIIFKKVSLIIASFIASYLLRLEFGGIGFLSVVLFYLFYDKKFATFITQVFVFSLYPITDRFFASKPYGSGSLIYYYMLLLPSIIISLSLIFFYNKRSGPKLKYFFYSIYPTQFIIFYFLKILLVQ